MHADGQQMANRRPTVGQQTADSRPTDGQQTADSRPTDGRQSTDSRPTGFLGSSSSQLPYSRCHIGSHGIVQRSFSSPQRSSLGSLKEFGRDLMIFAFINSFKTCVRIIDDFHQDLEIKYLYHIIYADLITVFLC